LPELRWVRCRHSNILPDGQFASGKVSVKPGEGHTEQARNLLMDLGDHASQLRF
jgi:hypothetical protein